MGTGLQWRSLFSFARAASLISILLAFFSSVGGENASAQESCANLQYQLGVLRSSGGAGSQWDAFILQRMQQLGCYGGQQSVCPAGTQYCGNSNQCCNSGFYCSRYGCTPQGAVECGNHYCNPGFQCSRGGGCIPQDTVDCGSYYCQADQKCAIGRRACLPTDIVDCGPKVNGTCPSGRVCWTASYEIPDIVKKGKTLCLTREAATKFDERIKELKEEKRRTEKEKREAERRAAEERKAEARRKAEEKRAEAKRKREERLAEIQRKKEEARAANVRVERARRMAAEVEAARRAREEAERERQRTEARLDKQLLATMNNRRESLAARKIAAIALGKDPDKIEGGLHGRADRTAAPPRGPSAEERKLAEIAMGKVNLQGTYKKPTSSDDMLRAVMNNPNESMAARKIAAFGLGMDANSVGSKPPPANNAPNYSFAPTRYGTVEVSKNGQRIATVTPQLAAQQYGYNAGGVPQVSQSNRPATSPPPLRHAATPPVHPVPVTPKNGPPVENNRLSAFTTSPQQPGQSQELWVKLKAASKDDLRSAKLPSGSQLSAGLGNLTQKRSANTFSATPAPNSTTVPKTTINHAAKLATLKNEARREAQLHGLSIDRVTAKHVLPYALMSQDAYVDENGFSGTANIRRLSSDWQTVLRSAGYSNLQIKAYELSGFSAAIYRNDKSGEITVAYRGTELTRPIDLISDINGAIAGTIRTINPRYVDQQYEAAAALAKSVKQKWPAGTTISLTGHSLGGGLASYAGGQNGISNVVTFNAARNAFSRTVKNPTQINVAVPGELIGDANTKSVFGSGALPGQLYSVRSPTDAPGLMGNFIGTHSLGGIIDGLKNIAK